MPLSQGEGHSVGDNGRWNYFFFIAGLVLTAALSTAPALNTGRWLSGIVIAFLVRMSRPGRAARCRTSNVPNPVSVTLSPDFNASVIASRTAFTASSAFVRDIPVV